MDRVYSVIEGDNSEALPPILSLYVPNGSRIADVTHGPGVFWKQVERNVTGSDIEPMPGVSLLADFATLPYAAESLECVVFDPPYKLTGTPKVRDRYGNKSGGWREVPGYYETGIAEANRILSPGGVLIVKCMDQVASGVQHWYHRIVYDLAVEDHGMFAEDLFVLVRPNPTPQPHRRQVHSHKRHSWFWVFRKK